MGIQDFSLRDILSPEGKRTCIVLSHVINFLKYREEKYPTYDKCVQEGVGGPWCC